MAASASTSKVASDGTQLTYNETLDVLCGFIKTAIHTILCHRQIYPTNVFTRRQRYRVPVWASRHPGLTSYIDEVVDAAKVQIEKNALRSLHVVLTSISSGQVLERYRFDVITLLNHIQPRDRNLSIPGNMTMDTIELHLRAFMMKLISLDGALGDIDNVENVTWAVVLDMKDGLEPQTEDKSGNEPAQGPWVPYDDVSTGRERNATDSNISEVQSEQNGPLILPVKSLDTGVINLMLYVEENPSAKRGSQVKSIGSGGSIRSQRRAPVAEDAIAAATRAGERDIDAPLPVASSSGAVATAGGGKSKSKRKSKKTTVQAEEDDDGTQSSLSDSSGSGTSIRSVNDFAGYGKGAGSVGMSGVGM